MSCSSERLDPQQGVADATVPHVHLRRLDEPPTQVASPGLQAADQKQVHHQAEVAADGDAADVEPSGEGGSVEHLSLIVRQHGPEAAEGLGRDTRPECGDVALEIGANEIEPPVETAFVGLRQKTFRKTAPLSQMQAVATADLRDAEWIQLAIRNAARQSFAGLLHQVDGRGAQKQELPGALPGPPAPIDDAAQGSEQPRGPVHLVQHRELAGVDLAVLFDVDDLGEVARSPFPRKREFGGWMPTSAGAPPLVAPAKAWV